MAAPSSSFEAMRRSTRVRAEIPVRVRSLDPHKPFDLLTRTLIVNAQGCGLHSSSDLPVGCAVEMAIADRVIRGRILNSTAVDPQKSSWVTGIELETPGNVWALPNPPADWASFAAAAKAQAPHPFAKGVVRTMPSAAAPVSAPPTPPPVPVAPPAQISPDDTLRELKSRADALTEEIAARLRSQGTADWESLRQQTESSLRELQETMARELASHAAQLRSEAQQTGEAFQRLSRTADERHKVMLADLQVRETELKVREQALASVSEGITAQITRQVEQAMGGLRAQIDEVVSRQEADLAARVAGHHSAIEDKAKTGRDSMDALYAAANRALEQLEERERSAAAVNAEMVRAAEAALESIDQHRARAEASVQSAADSSIEKLKAELAERERQFDAKAQQAGWDYDAQVQAAGERLDGRLATALSKVEAALEEGRTALAAAAEAQRQAMGTGIADATRAETERQLASLSEHAKKQAESLRKDLENSVAERSKDLDARHGAVTERLAELTHRQDLVNGQLAELQQLKQQIESYGSALKESMATDAQRHAAEAWSNIKADSEAQIARVVAAEAERSASRVGSEIEASARRLSEEMAAHADKTAADLQARLADALASRQQQIARDMEAALQQATTQLSAEAQRQAQVQQKTAQEIYESALERLQRVASRSETLLGETEAALQKSTQEVVASEIARAQREIRGAVGPEIEGAAAKLRAETERLAAAQSAADSQAEALRKQLEEAREWLLQNTAQFQQSVHDAFLQAGGEIRGRVHAAVDTADEMILQKSRSAIAAMDSAGALQTARLAEQAEEMQRRIAAAQANVNAAAESALQEKLADTLQRFRDDAARLAQSAGLRWQSAIDDTLRSLPDLLRSRLEEASEPK